MNPPSSSLSSQQRQRQRQPKQQQRRTTAIQRDRHKPRGRFPTNGGRSLAHSFALSAHNYKPMGKLASKHDRSIDRFMCVSLCVYACSSASQAMATQRNTQQHPPRMILSELPSKTPRVHCRTHRTRISNRSRRPGVERRDAVPVLQQLVLYPGDGRGRCDRMPVAGD